MGDLQVIRGSDEEARQHYERALRLRRELYDDHVDIAWTLLPLAEVRFRQGDRAEAEKLRREARSILAAQHKTGIRQGLYHEACFAALRERTAEAILLLRRAAAESRLQPSWLDSPSLASLHGLPEFEEIVVEARGGR